MAGRNRVSAVRTARARRFSSNPRSRAPPLPLLKPVQPNLRKCLVRIDVAAKHVVATDFIGLQRRW